MLFFEYNSTKMCNLSMRYSYLSYQILWKSKIYEWDIIFFVPPSLQGMVSVIEKIMSGTNSLRELVCYYMYLSTIVP